MKKTNILIAMFSVIAASSAAMADTGTIGNLSAATGKISAVDMNKDFGKAGGILDGLFTGVQPRKENVSVAVDLRASGGRTIEQAVKEVCNAAPTKYTASASKVPAIIAEPDGTGNTAGAMKKAARITPHNIPANKMDGWDHTDVYTPIASAVGSLPNNGTDTSIGALLGAIGAVVGGAASVGVVVGGAIIGAVGGYVADLENDD